MLQELWDGILDLTSKLVIPDWGALVALIPLALGLFILAWLFAVARRWATAGPTRRGRRRLAPVPPEGVHASHGSWAPIFAAIGTGLLFFGLVFGPALLALGAMALTLSLLYWLREANRDYEALEATVQTLPAVVSEPPEGIHMPGPSFRPLLAAMATATLLLGLVFGFWLTLAGIVFLLVVLLGWLADARKEYVETVAADGGGHLRALPAPSYPTVIVAAFVVLIVIATAVDFGLLPPSSGQAAGGGGEPAPSGEPGGSGPPPASEAPAPEADVVIRAKDITYLEKTASAPADQPFTIAFVNEDSGVPHDVEIRQGDEAVFKGEVFSGVETRVYDVPALAAGDYTFICTIHPIPAMTGTLTVGG